MEIAIIIFFLAILLGSAFLGVVIFIAWKLFKRKKEKFIGQGSNFSQSTHDSNYLGNYTDNTDDTASYAASGIVYSSVIQPEEGTSGEVVGADSENENRSPSEGVGVSRNHESTESANYYSSSDYTESSATYSDSSNSSDSSSSNDSGSSSSSD